MATSTLPGTRLRLGDTVPDFTAQSTQGRIRWGHWARGRWAILLGHPAAFTPICTSEVGLLANAMGYLGPRGFQAATLSCDGIQDLTLWRKDVEAFMGRGVKLPFPMLADPTLRISAALGLIDPDSRDAQHELMISRTMYIVGPDGKVKFVCCYPGAIGRSMDELVRICDALLLTFQSQVATPASWPDNHGTLEVDGKAMQGAVFLSTKVTEDEATRLFPEFVSLSMPSGKNYMRLTHMRRKPQREQGWRALARALCCLCGAAEAPGQQLPNSENGPGSHAGDSCSSGRGPGRTAPWAALRLLPQRSLKSTSGWLAGGFTSTARPDPKPPDRYWRPMRVGEVVPDFTAATTHGQMVFHKWIEGRWTVLFSHPAAFTPVCTTEVGTLALKHNTLRSIGFQVAVLSSDRLADIMAWKKDVASHFSNQIMLGFPMIEDPEREVSAKFGMIDPDLKDQNAALMTSRTVFVIGPDKKVCLSMDYPGFVGRSIHEVIRACEALRFSYLTGLGMPANWPDSLPDMVVAGNPLQGSVFVMPGREEEADKNYPERIRLPLPSGRSYINLTHIKTKTPFVTPCATCISGVYKA